MQPRVASPTSYPGLARHQFIYPAKGCIRSALERCEIGYSEAYVWDSRMDELLQAFQAWMIYWGYSQGSSSDSQPWAICF